MNWIEAFDFDDYEVNELGELRNAKTLKVLKPRLDNRDYVMYRIYKGGRKYTKRIGKLVWESFNNCKCRQVVDHIDRNKLNNRIENLRCISEEENSRNRDNYGRYNKYNITPEMKKEIMEKRFNEKRTITSLAKEYGIPFNYLSIVFQRGTWLRYIDDGTGIQQV